jgi:hypothetical protein
MRTRSRCSAVSAALLIGALVLLPAVPAAAASGITAPGDGEIVAADAVVPVRAEVDGPAVRPSELRLRAPGSDVDEVVAVQSSPEGGSLAYDFDTSCAQRLCTGRAPAVNGTWTVLLSGAASDERSFVLRIPPAQPTGVAAEPAEAGVVVRWQRGAEPDLTGYAVENGAGAVLRGGIGLDACDAEGTCRVELPEDGGAWSVRAFRSACPDCRDDLASIASDTVRVGGAASGPELPPAVGGGGGSSADPSSRPAAPSGPDQRTAFARAFGSGRPAGPAGAQSPAAAAAPAPQLPDGSYDATLGYTAPQAGSAPGASRAQDALDSAVGGDRTALIVTSVVMVGVAWWLRRWARRVIDEP